MIRQQSQSGFTLVEMIMVIVITGIIGGMVAVFLKAPIQQYMDVARRADLTDIADTAVRRVTRDLRLALPNSVRVRNAAGTPCGLADVCYLEFIPTTGGGRYRSGAGGTGDTLNIGVLDLGFEVLGPMPPAFTGGESIVVYNLGIAGADAYEGTSRTTTAVAIAGNSITIAAPGKAFPFDSCQQDAVTGNDVGCRFQVITTPVTYVCSPAAGGVGGTLTRWQGYAITAAQPIAVPAGVTPAVLANNVSACNFSYVGVIVAQRSGLVTMRLAISRDGETVSLYNATHVSNQP